MTNNNAKQAGQCLIDLAEILTDDDCVINAGELLENITGHSISEEDAGDIKEYLYS